MEILLALDSDAGLQTNCPLAKNLEIDSMSICMLFLWPSVRVWLAMLKDVSGQHLLLDFLLNLYLSEDTTTLPVRQLYTGSLNCMKHFDWC